MGRNINSIELSGYVGNSEVVQLGQNEALKFSIAYQESYKPKDGDWVNETTWFNCIKWKPTKTDKENIHKGLKIFVAGKMTAKKKEDITYWTLTVRDADYEVKKTEQDDDTPF